MSVKRRFVRDGRRATFLEALYAAVEGEGLEDVQGRAAGGDGGAHAGFKTGYVLGVGGWWWGRRA